MSKSKVSFDPNIQIKCLCVWPYAHWIARKNDWESKYLDRIRFQDKIKAIEQVLHPVLLNHHRRKVYSTLLSYIATSNHIMTKKQHADITHNTWRESSIDVICYLQRCTFTQLILNAVVAVSVTATFITRAEPVAGSWNTSFDFFVYITTRVPYINENKQKMIIFILLL